MVGEAIEWILATARRPNRVMALAGAIALGGTLIGRRVAGPTGAGTHLYAVVVGPTGGGKQHPIDCVHDLMVAAGAQERIGPGIHVGLGDLQRRVTLAVVAMLHGRIRRQYLAKLMPAAPPCTNVEVSGVMRSLWGPSFSLYPTPEWADRESSRIHSPALGFTAPGLRTNCSRPCRASAIENGLLNRFLVLRSQLP